MRTKRARACLNVKWKCNILVAGLAFISFCTLRVQASETVFGQLDSFTGEMIEEQDGSSDTQPASTRIKITDKMYYDTEKEMYGYYAGDEDVYATVADGMIVKNEVTITIPEQVSSTIYWEGRSSEFSGGTLANPGSYTVEIAGNGTTTQLFSFMIVKSTTNQVPGYTMPEGFRITGAVLEGVEVPWTMNFVEMTTEGHYVVDYECSRAGIPYKLDVIVDTTPPVLVFDGVDESGRARGPVAISDIGPEDTLTVTRNGEEVSMLLSHVLTASGRYVVTVTDSAGNSNSYPITIMLYFDKNARIFSILFLVVVIAIVSMFMYFKKHLRVR